MESDQEVEKFRAQIWRPPPRTVTIDSRSPWSPENEARAFGALKKQTGG